MMEQLVLFIKTYDRDVHKVARLLNTIEVYNKDKLPIYISTKRKDETTFHDVIGTPEKRGYIHVFDEDIIECDIQNGWRYQQVIKANFHKLDIAENYVCIDSDSTFIRGFRKSDFIYDEEDGIPYTICHDSVDMNQYMSLSGRNPNESFYRKAQKAIRTHLLDSGETKTWDWGPSPFIWSTKVWRQFEEFYLKPSNLTFTDFLRNIERLGKTEPSEYVLYGELLFAWGLFDIIPIGPLFKVYHWKDQWEWEIENGMYDVDKLRENYMGVILQSNWHE